MKTLKISEEAHTTLLKLQLNLYQLTGKKYTFSELIERFYIEDLSEPKEYKFDDK